MHQRQRRVRIVRPEHLLLQDIGGTIGFLGGDIILRPVGDRAGCHQLLVLADIAGTERLRSEPLGRQALPGTRTRGRSRRFRGNPPG